MTDLKLPGNILDPVQHIHELPSPRLIKSHLQWSLLPVQIREKERRPKDKEGAILKTAAFLEKAVSKEDVKVLAEHLSFDKMKKNSAVNLEPVLEMMNGPEFLSKTDLRFIRKGQVGDWKNHMSDALAARFDSWTEEHLWDTGLSFD